VQQGAALFASIDVEACDAICQQHSEFGIYCVPLLHAKDVATTLKLPLIVPLEHVCDIQTQEEIHFFYLAHPDKPTSFPKKKQ
jgi:hypothetical protein